jgi:hypothetical protein
MDKVQKSRLSVCYTSSLKPNGVEPSIVLHNITDAGFNSPCWIFGDISITILNSVAQLFLFKGF